MSSLSGQSYSGDQAGLRKKLNKMPELPQDVLQRFPSLKTWQDDMEKWRQQLLLAIQGRST